VYTGTNGGRKDLGIFKDLILVFFSYGYIFACVLLYLVFFVKMCCYTDVKM